MNIEFDIAKVPVEYMKDGIYEYVYFGRPVGHFMYALLTNNLKDTYAHADTLNKARLGDWVHFITREVPHRCQGSTNRVDIWMSHGGAKGLAEYLSRVDDT
jgi:hypothetical protein